MRDITIERLTFLAERLRHWHNTGSQKIPKDERLELAMMMASTLNNFVEFMELGMKFLGFSASDMQRDIAHFMAYGPERAMVAAQRGEAKTTLAALLAVWRIIQDQSTRVMIISAAGKQSSDVAVLIIRLIESWPLLCYLRADQQKGDRTSYEAYDVHCDLKRTDKTASISCRSMTGQITGSRADLLIADDIETPENGFSHALREQLLTKSKEFSAIASDVGSRILYLGTPQTKHSIYKTLPARGFTVRVWPGRFPTATQIEQYGNTLAPWILAQIEANPALAEPHCGISGDMGAPADPMRYSEDQLCEKELDYGPEGFSLQFMLDTTLSDEARTRIKLSDMIFYAGSYDVAPEAVWYAADTKRQIARDVHGAFGTAKTYSPMGTSDVLRPYQLKVMRVDPAGNGGDEIAFAAAGALSGYLHLLAVGGYAGGVNKENMQKILLLAKEIGVNQITIESNMGHGTVKQLFQAEMFALQIKGIALLDDYAKGQKERRIIDCISPVTRRHRLIVHESAVEMDHDTTRGRPADKRNLYSAFFQMANMTYDRGCLAKDDRADAVEGVVRDLQAFLGLDEEKAAAARDAAAAKEYLNNPMGYKDSKWKNERNKQRRGTHVSRSRR